MRRISHTSETYADSPDRYFAFHNTTNVSIRAPITFPCPSGTAPQSVNMNSSWNPAFSAAEKTQTDSNPEGKHERLSTLPTHSHSFGKNLGTLVPEWFDDVKTALLRDCFSNGCQNGVQVADVTEEDVTGFVTSLHPPPFLTSQQKVVLSQLLQNVETWWCSSFHIMQTIHEESSHLLGFPPLIFPSIPLPLIIQHKLKTIVRSLLYLLRLPTATTLPQRENGSEGNQQMSPSEAFYWRALSQNYTENPKMVLKEWLYQHFDKPYPSDEEKDVLASLTRLTRSQVSNWFINARVRIWQPLIMELGKELEMEEEPFLYEQESSTESLKLDSSLNDKRSLQSIEVCLKEEAIPMESSPAVVHRAKKRFVEKSEPGA